MKAPILVTDAASAEMIKYASNAFLATKISFINAIANLCEEVNADVREVVLGMGYDSRIGFEFLHPGPGYGGSCFPKDTAALVHTAGEAGYDFSLLRGVVDVNRAQHQRMVDKVRAAAGGDLHGATVAIWGLTFKANTDDLRDSPALEIAAALLAEGARVLAYDPVTGPEAAERVPGLEVVGDPYAAVRRRVGARAAHRVGRVPLARLRRVREAMAAPARGRRPQPARPGRAAPPRLRLRGHRPMTRDARPMRSSSPAAPASSAPISATPCSPAATRWSRSTTSSPVTRANVMHLADDPGFAFVEADVDAELPVDGAVHAVLHFASAASPPDYLAHPLETLDVGSLGTRRGLDLARAHGARFLLASTSEIYGDPLVHPQPESYWGNVNPRRARGRSTTRPSASARRSPWRTTASSASTPRSCASSTPTARGCPSPTAGWCRTSSTRRCAASRSPSTATAPRPVRSATSTTRCAASWACSTRRTSDRSTSATPTSSRCWSWPSWCSRSPARTSELVFEPLPTDDPKQRRPDITLAESVLGWRPEVDLREGLTRTHDWYRRTGG